MTTEDKRAFFVRMPAEMHDDLRALAFVTRTSMNSLVLDAVKTKIGIMKSMERHRALLERLDMDLGAEEVADGEQ